MGTEPTEIGDIAFDSREVGPGTLFFCVVGHTADGHDFAPDVVEAGAAALVTERELDLDVPQLDRRRLAAGDGADCGPLVRRSERRAPHGRVTGTNGKTTTAFLVRSILESAGLRCGLLGTVKQIVGGGREEVERTTPEAIDLQRTFRRMLDAGDRACVMEVSSHALDPRPRGAIHFDVAAFTNLTQDHLDFHSGMEDYFAGQAGSVRPGGGRGGIRAGHRRDQRRRPLREAPPRRASAGRRSGPDHASPPPGTSPT